MKFINIEPQKVVDFEGGRTNQEVSLYFEMVENGKTFVVTANGEIETSGEPDIGDYITAPYCHEEIMSVTAYEPEIYWQGVAIDRKNTDLLLCHVERLLTEHCSE